MKALIIAPHIDDETIGCWSVLNDPELEVTVMWLNELTPERVKEAQSIRLVDYHVFGAYDDEAFFSKFDAVYVPSRRDWHPAHKEANAQFRKWATHYYSVDMKHGLFLGDEKAKAKRKALDEWFPSQASLWANDAKYYLFEDIQAVDYDTYAVIHRPDCTVTVPVMGAMSAKRILATTKGTKKELFEALLQHMPQGKVRLEAQDIVYESEA